MSTVAVRAIVRAAVQAAAPGVQIVEVAGVRVNPASLQSPWIAIGYEAGAQTRLSIGDPSLWIETGTVYVAVVVTAGAGDATLNGLCDQITNAMRDFSDAATGFRITSVSLGAQAEEDSDGRWFSRTVLLSYERVFYG